AERERWGVGGRWGGCAGGRGRVCAVGDHPLCAGEEGHPPNRSEDRPWYRPPPRLDEGGDAGFEPRSGECQEDDVRMGLAQRGAARDGERSESKVSRSTGLSR